jgi:hypothetical protein
MKSPVFLLYPSSITAVPCRLYIVWTLPDCLLIKPCLAVRALTCPGTHLQFLACCTLAFPFLAVHLMYPAYFYDCECAPCFAILSTCRILPGLHLQYPAWLYTFSTLHVCVMLYSVGLCCILPGCPVPCLAAYTC